MKTLVELDEKLLENAQKAVGAKTKRETITYALLELLRAKNRRKLRDMIGHYRHDMSLKELLTLRSRS